MLMDSLVQLRAPIKNKQLKLYQKARDVTQWVERCIRHQVPFLAT